MKQATTTKGSAAGMAQANIDTLKSLITDTKQSVEELSGRFDTFRNALPDAYVPRREVEGNLRELRERQAGHETRLTAMEEWRLAETQRAAQAQLAIQAQIQAEAITAARAIADAREKSQVGDSEHRSLLDTRSISWLQAVLLMLGGALVYFVLNHIPLH